MLWTRHVTPPLTAPDYWLTVTFVCVFLLLVPPKSRSFRDLESTLARVDDLKALLRLP